MSQIRPLSSSIINKIAAGEVVERPFSVVKELTENAIDAGASTVTVEIRDGGLTQIRVTDNGGGIEAEQLPLAFARHATSKIADADDLFNITTLGFRGEALASIAEVAQVEMVSKRAGELLGARIEIHGGAEVARQEVGCADGTTVMVSNLFYSTPARRKFMKKPSTEAGYISEVMQRLALGNPGLSFRYIQDGRLVLQTNGNGDLKTAIHYVYGREISSKLLPVAKVGAEAGRFKSEQLDLELRAPADGADRGFGPPLAHAPGLSVEGYIGRPEIARGNRQYGLFFLNGRYIQSRLLQRAVEDALRTVLPSGKFPVYVFRLAIDPADVDVNVHPAKTEVRFGEEEEVYTFLRDAVRGALNGHSLIPEARLGRKNRKETAEPEFEEQTLNETADRPAVRGNLSEAVSVFGVSTARDSVSSHDADGASVSDSLNDVISAEPGIHSAYAFNLEPDKNSARAFAPETGSRPISAFDSALSLHETPDLSVRPAAQGTSPFFTDYALLGLLFKTYWLVAQEDSLYLIDQHAAHERVLYEDILKALDTRGVFSQAMLEPLRLRLTPREAQTLADHQNLFGRFGFEFHFESEDRAVVTAVPFIFKGPVAPEFFTTLLDKLETMGSVDEGSLHRNKIGAVAMSACKAAVKAHDTLSEPEARALLKRMLALEQPFTCPHGRPTIIEITKRELERKFGRVK